MRSANLEKGLRNLLGAPQGQGKLVSELYKYPLIKGLAKSGKLPSYIPSRSFAQALPDTIAPSDPNVGPKILGEMKKAVNAAGLLPQETKKALLVLLWTKQMTVSEKRGIMWNNGLTIPWTGSRDGTSGRPR